MFVVSTDVAVPMTVIVYFPSGTELPTVIVATLVPVSGFVPNAMVTPAGAPEYVNVALFEPRMFVRLMSVGPVEFGAMTTIGGTVCNEKLTWLPKCEGAGVQDTGFESSVVFAWGSLFPNGSGSPTGVPKTCPANIGVPLRKSPFLTNPHGHIKLSFMLSHIANRLFNWDCGQRTCDRCVCRGERCGQCGPLRGNVCDGRFMLGEANVQ